MFRKITIAALLVAATSSPTFARTRSVSTGGSVADAALMPIKVSGATVTGFVTAVSGNIISLANGLVTIDASNAKIVDERSGTATVAAIKAGSSILAVISSDVTTNTALPAATIAVRNIPQVELTGAVSAVGATSLTVLGRTINVDANTSFGGRAVRLADIVVGDLVDVSANVSGGTLLATSVMATIPPPRPAMLIHGTVKSIAADAWVITDREGKEWKIVVNTQTKIVGDPKVGDSVEILANLDSSNQYVAVSITKTVVVPAPLVFNGVVKSISATSLVIHQSRDNRDVTFAINDKTKISGNPQVNDSVNVTATADAAGNYTATQIVKLGIVPPAITITVRGVVKSIIAPGCPAPICDWSIWTVGDTQFRVDSTTKLTGNPGRGDNVVAVLQKVDAGYIALSVEKQP